MTTRDRATTAAALLLAIWGAALLSLGALDHALYERFLASLMFR